MIVDLAPTSRRRTGTDDSSSAVGKCVFKVLAETPETATSVGEWIESMLLMYVRLYRGKKGRPSEDLGGRRRVTQGSGFTGHCTRFPPAIPSTSPAPAMADPNEEEVSPRGFLQHGLPCGPCPARAAPRRALADAGCAAGSAQASAAGASRASCGQQEGQEAGARRSCQEEGQASAGLQARAAAGLGCHQVVGAVPCPGGEGVRGPEGLRVGRRRPGGRHPQRGVRQGESSIAWSSNQPAGPDPTPVRRSPQTS